MAPVKHPKLLFYIPGLLDGGAERLWACLASALYARGYPVVFAVDFEASENRAGLDAAIPLHVLGSSHAVSIKLLAEILAAEAPDVALSAVAGSNLKLMLARRLAKSTVAPILTYHGAHEWKTGALSFANFALLPLMSRFARIVAVSESLRSKLVTSWGASANRTRAILNPVYVPADAPLPALDDVRSRSPLILAAGRLSREKDFLTLVRAVALVKSPGARLTILGKGPEQATIEQEIARLGLGRRIALAGYVSEPWPYYRDARVFVSSSQTEAFGNTLVEAMAHGLSVVATSCEGPREILDGGTYGRLTPVGNPAALATAIDGALENPSDPQRMRRRAAEFSFEARVPLYEQLIADALAERREHIPPSTTDHRVRSQNSARFVP